MALALHCEPACLILTGDFVVVGDIHGDLSTLLRIFDRFGYPPLGRYLFLGDYVDRGSCSCGVIFLLFSLRLLFPDHFHLIRGNHESRVLTELHGLREECLDAMLTCFSAILNSKVFCVHGGIPSQFTRLEAITKGDCAVAEDLLWSDPTTAEDWFSESYRGKGHLFGVKAASDFLNRAGLVFMIRSHEVCLEGYDYPFGDAGRVMTVFSSCDYCGQKSDCGVALVSSCKLEAEYLAPVTELELPKRRVLLPMWLMDRVTINAIETWANIGAADLLREIAAMI
jgi:protein phosphatase